MKRTSIIAALAAVGLSASCTSMDQLYSNSNLVLLDGEEFMVRQLRDPNAYHAVPNRPGDYGMSMFLNPAAAAKNVRAIEQHTGCIVVRESIQNADLNTMAMVTC